MIDHHKPVRLVTKLLGVLLPASAAASQRVNAAGSSRPSFILILADDFGYGDIGPFGSKSNHTPHLGRTAREGMKFTSFYAAPVCTPSCAREVPDDPAPSAPHLCNLDAEIGEQTDVASQHAGVVTRLRELVAQMDTDLGTTNIGPGVRPPGHVEKRIGPWLPGHEPKQSKDGAYPR